MCLFGTSDREIMNETEIILAYHQEFPENSDCFIQKIYKIKTEIKCDL